MQPGRIVLPVPEGGFRAIEILPAILCAPYQ